MPEEGPDIGKPGAEPSHMLKDSQPWGWGEEGRALCCQGHEETPVPPYMGKCEQVLGGKGLGDASHCLPVKRRILRPGEATERCRVALSQELNTLDCAEDSPEVCLSSLQDRGLLGCRIH